MPESADWRSLYPFASHEIVVGSHRYHYLDEGAGAPLLLVHGNPTWSFYWRRLVVGLRDRYRLIVPDHIGCGQSDKPQDYPYRLAQHAANLQRLICFNWIVCCYERADPPSCVAEHLEASCWVGAMAD